MKRILFLFFVLSFLGAGCSRDAFSFDFGRVKQGEVLRHIFVFQNKTGKVLNIKDIQTSCGCTVSKVKDKTNLLAGESTSIEVEFNTKDYSGPSKQYSYVYTDSIDNPVFRFIIKATVIK